MKKFIIAVYVDNKFGVLTRVTSMFTRRGFNIDALTVGKNRIGRFFPHNHNHVRRRRRKGADDKTA